MLAAASTPGGLPESATRPVQADGALAGGPDATAADDNRIGANGANGASVADPAWALHAPPGSAARGSTAGTDDPEALDDAMPLFSVHGRGLADGGSDASSMLAGLATVDHGRRSPMDGRGSAIGAPKGAPSGSEDAMGAAAAVPGMLEPASSRSEQRRGRPRGSRKPRKRANAPMDAAMPLEAPDSAEKRGAGMGGAGLRVVGYTRVSTEGQAADGVSLDSQKQRITAWVEANAGRLGACYTDAGVSGKRADNRPGLQAALADVCKHGGALVVYSLSRLARSTRDAIAIAERLDKAGADLVSLTEKIDTTTAAGKMVFRLLAVLSEFERDLASERTRAALAHKAAKGERTGDIPYGWDLAPDCIQLVENPAEQCVLARIREWRTAGATLREIADRLTDVGIPTKKQRARWTHQSVGRIVVRASERPEPLHDGDQRIRK